MHYNREVEDVRPRVDVRFLGHDRPVTYSLMFDTGSDITHIRVEAPAASATTEEFIPDSTDPELSSSYMALRPALEGEGYVDVGAGEVVGGGRDLYYGDDASLRAVPVQRRIREMAQIYSAADTFAHELIVDLTSAVDNRHTGVGLLGAGRTSEFAEAVGVFAFHPPTAAYMFGGSPNAGTLIIGERDFLQMERDHCAAGANLRFTNLRTDVSRTHWVISGNIVSGLGVANAITWVVDTGAGGFYVDQATFDQTVVAIGALGAIVEPYRPRYYTFIRNCGDRLRFPDVFFTLGAGNTATTVRIPATDYVQQYDATACLLKLQPSGMTSLGGARLLGIGVLSKLFTVFDRESDRLGFCIKRDL